MLNVNSATDNLPSSVDNVVDEPEQLIDDETTADSQSVQFYSESTWSAFSQNSMQWQDSEEVPVVVDMHDKECQTVPVYILEEAEYQYLVRKASDHCDFKEELDRIRTSLSTEEQNPDMNPENFEKFCNEVGAGMIFKKIHESMCSERMSESRHSLNKLRTMVIIYMLIYGRCQRANSFQVALSRTLKQFGISEQGLISLRNLGIAAHPHTVRAAAKSSAASHSDNLVSFFQEAVESKQFIVVMIDDYHNIHTKHRPEKQIQTDTVHMATLLVKAFPQVKAISKDDTQVPLLSKDPLQIEAVQRIFHERMSLLCGSYAQNMPNWVVAKYFDPNFERQRLMVHDYQQTELRKMRCMDGCKLIDSIELPLKSSADILSAFNHMLSNGLSIYLDQFLAPFVGDWPTQFYMRQIAYCNDGSVPALCKNIAPVIGPLHISLNSRECLVLNFHPVFAELYSYLFGKKATLAKKPRPWRMSLLLEVLYGGWTLIRDTILPVFSACKDVEYLTLLNLVDNYIPLVLSLYSIIFKCNDYENYYLSLLRCWVMMMVYQRRHYDKALLIALSLFDHWKTNCHPFHEAMVKALSAFDEYPVENFHSILRGRTKETDTASQIALMAKEIDACKHELNDFKCWFVPPKKFNFSQKRIDDLKVKAAGFLTAKFKAISDDGGKAIQLPRAQGQRKNVTKWKLPNIFGDTTVTQKVLPLGFTAIGNQPNPKK